MVALPTRQAALRALARKRRPDVRWIVRENLRKKRLERMDREWSRALARAVSAVWGPNVVSAAITSDLRSFAVA